MAPSFMQSGLHDYSTLASRPGRPAPSSAEARVYASPPWSPRPTRSSRRRLWREAGSSRPREPAGGLAFDGRGLSRPPPAGSRARTRARGRRDRRGDRRAGRLDGRTSWLGSCDQPTCWGTRSSGQAVDPRRSSAELGSRAVDVPMDAEALRAHPSSRAVRLGRRRQGATWWRRGIPEARGPTGRSLILNGHIDVVESGAARAMGWPRDPFVAHAEDGWIVRPGRRRHEVRSRGHPGCGQGAPGGSVSSLTRRSTLESVVEEECTGNGTLADRARRLHGRRGRDRRAVRRGHHHLAGRRAVVPRPDHRARRACGRERTRRERDREQPADDPGAPRCSSPSSTPRPPPPYDAVPPPDRPQRRHDPRRRLAVDGAGRVHHRVPHRAVPRHGRRGAQDRIEAVVAEAARPTSRCSRIRRGASTGVPQPRVRDRRRPRARDARWRAPTHGTPGSPPPSSRPPAPPTPRVFGNVGGIPAVCFGPYAEQAHGVGERVYLPSVIADGAGHRPVHPGLVRSIEVAAWLVALAILIVVARAARAYAIRRPAGAVARRARRRDAPDRQPGTGSERDRASSADIVTTSPLVGHAGDPQLLPNERDARLLRERDGVQPARASIAGCATSGS